MMPGPAASHDPFPRRGWNWPAVAAAAVVVVAVGGADAGAPRGLPCERHLRGSWWGRRRVGDGESSGGGAHADVQVDRRSGNERSRPRLPDGVVDVVEAFAADPTGAADATPALQRALIHARTHNVTLFLPRGCYRVRDTLNATQPRNGRWQPIHIVGEAPTAAWPHPPVVFLAASTPGFGGGVERDAHDAADATIVPNDDGRTTTMATTAAAPATIKPMITWLADWCLAPGAEEGRVESDCEDAEGQAAAGVTTGDRRSGHRANPHGAATEQRGETAGTPTVTPPPPHRVNINTDWHSIAYNFNNVLRGVDFDIGSGNPRAVAVAMYGAQGTTMEDVTVRAAPDAAAGVAGGNGGGGSFKGVTVIGGRYGLLSRKAGEAPLHLAMTLVNQTCAGVLHTVRTTLIATGLYIRGAPRLGGVLADVDSAVYGVPECVLPGVLNEAAHGSGAVTRSSGASFPSTPLYPDSNALGAAVSLVDSVVHLTPADLAGEGARAAAAPPCIIANSSIYLSNVYVDGCATAIASGGRAPIATPPATLAAHYDVVGLGRVRAPQPARIVRAARAGEDTGERTTAGGPNASAAPAEPLYAFPAYTDGVRVAEGVVRAGDGQHDRERLHATARALQRRHWVPGARDWQSTRSVDAKAAGGCVGDGVADDYIALQRLLDGASSGDVVVLPKGIYRVSRGLVVRTANITLTGVGRTLSIIAPMTDAAAGIGEAAVLRVAADDVTVWGITVVTWDHIEGAFAVEWNGARGVWRSGFFNRVAEDVFPPFDWSIPPQHDRNTTTGGTGARVPRPRRPTVFNRSLSVISGTGRFYDYNLDFGCCFGTVVPPATSPAPGPGEASSGEILLQGPGYRSLLVNNSRGGGVGGDSGVAFYPLNLEQDFGEAHCEIRNSSNVVMHGAKSENNYVVLWIVDSTAVALHGYGGNASPFVNRTRGPEHIRRDSRPAAFFPSLFRVQRSRNIRLANLVDKGRITPPDLQSPFVAAGNGTDPRNWNMVLAQDGARYCDPAVTPTLCSATAVMDRPVVWEWVGDRDP